MIVSSELKKKLKHYDDKRKFVYKRKKFKLTSGPPQFEK